MSSTLIIREATEADLPALIALFAADMLGGHGDTNDPEVFPAYQAAFTRIAASPASALYVTEQQGEVVGTFQTTILTTLPSRGSSSLLLEAVQTRSDRRGEGIGAAMIAFAVADARRQGLSKVHLTSNALRKDAHRFYERLGFKASHLGFSLAVK